MVWLGKNYVEMKEGYIVAFILKFWKNMVGGKMNSLKLEWFKLVKRVKIRGENKNKCFFFSFWHFEKKNIYNWNMLNTLNLLFICINAFILNFWGKWNKFNSVKLEQWKKNRS